MEHALQKQRQQGAVHAALNVSIALVCVAHLVLIFPKAYDVRRSPSPALSEDAQITVRRQQAKQASVRLVDCIALHARDLTIHLAPSHATADELFFFILQPRYHICAERNASEDVYTLGILLYLGRGFNFGIKLYRFLSLSQKKYPVGTHDAFHLSTRFFYPSVSTTPSSSYIE